MFESRFTKISNNNEAKTIGRNERGIFDDADMKATNIWMCINQSQSTCVKPTRLPPQPSTESKKYEN